MGSYNFLTPLQNSRFKSTPVRWSCAKGRQL
ncbi:MAG: hypothetical protein QG599_1421 [Pseudomonadota bacterium]|nr:hypothetical protein [Pseudomonadota bacterium]